MDKKVVKGEILKFDPIRKIRYPGTDATILCSILI